MGLGGLGRGGLPDGRDPDRAAGWVFSGGGAPRLELPAFALDLGAGRLGEVVTGSFPIRNPGSGLLQYAIQPSCSCGKIAPARGTVPPGRVQDVRVEVRLKEHGRKPITLTIQTNDPRNPSASYGMFVTCIPPLRISPESVNFGRVRKGTGPRASVEVASSSGKPLSPGTALEARSTNSYVTVSAERPGSGPARLVLAVSPDAPEGYHAGTVIVGTSDEEEMEVPFSVEIGPAIQVVPRTIRAEPDPATGRPRDVTLLAARPAADGSVVLLRWEGPEDIQVSPIPESSGSVARSRVHWTAQPVPADRRLRLFFRGEPDPVDLTIRFPVASARGVAGRE
jgi:hypothetical protein